MSGPRNMIRTWALIAVAVTSAALIYFAWRLIGIIAAPDWCSRALGFETRPELAMGECFALLQRQVEALALNSHFAIGTLGLCLAVLVIIVLAGGRVSFRAGRDGVEADVARETGLADG
ncbi:hypothetical protein [Altererythrobacter sp. Root672]|uniref:hypothetical protein n=1 Tax=Altererythrobacter sp. Root672 TaxID=1736584 RepID=UPI0006F38D0A|nr:hypothetical protein [Altererythrobacter sp. Root672]KRA83062.1 hypothetical protein ASD76_03015 [Altererythrobacter sp. Root672]